MNLLFIHQNCPGQFKHLAPRIAAESGDRVVFITQRGKPDVAGVIKAEYEPTRQPAPSTHRYLRLMEEAVLNGQAVARVALKLRRQGFHPDVVVAHVGWGEALYIKEVWPRTKLLGYFEWFYHPRGSDVGFLEQRPPDLDTACRIRSRNGLHLLNLETADLGVSPTRWQWRQHPRAYRDKLSIIHDGVDTATVRPNRSATGSLSSNLRLRTGDEVVTYVARKLEPYRGFPTFMRAAELILKRRPRTRILVIGADGVSYGSQREDGKSYREHYVETLDLDLERIHFLGRVSYQRYLRVLQLSAVHVYLSVPFVLSWSMLEAMAAECLVVGSRTPPVEEVIEDRKNGLLVDFFSPEQVADAVDRVLDHPDRMRAIRKAARQTILQRYELQDCIQRQVELIRAMVTGGLRRQGPEDTEFSPETDS